MAVPNLLERLVTAASWPFGVAWTGWHYMWRILPVHRTNEDGSLDRDLPPPLPVSVELRGVQTPTDGRGPLLHRRYTVAVADAEIEPHELIARLAAEPDEVAPAWVARFRKTRGKPGRLSVGDEFLVQMPGPWNGPVRVIDVGAEHFRFATLDGHLEAGQIEWRAWKDDHLRFAVESWARPGDRLSALLHDRLPMAKEVQLYMWTSLLERGARFAGGRPLDGIDVLTRIVPAETLEIVGDERLAAS
jgi:hypothetical protein